LFRYFFQGKIFALILRKNGLGYSLGDFLANESGHPGVDLILRICNPRQVVRDKKSFRRLAFDGRVARFFLTQFTKTGNI
jgi:hypothetical protein